jgi:hypothetical protein
MVLPCFRSAWAKNACMGAARNLASKLIKDKV